MTAYGYDLTKPSTTKSVILDVETLRGVSIILVMIAHATFLFPWPDAVYRTTSKLHFGIGVDLFFVISGYVIARSLWISIVSIGNCRQALLSFWVKRFFRLWPAAAVAIVTTVATVAMLRGYHPFSQLGDVRSYAVAGLASLTYWMNYWGSQRLATGQSFTILAHFWSLSLEEQFYIVFPLIAMVIRSKRVLGLLALLTIVLFSFVERYDLRSFWWWFRIDCLSWGVLIFCIQGGAKGAVASRRVLGAAVMITGLAGMLASSYVVPAGPGASTLASASAAMLVFAASFNSNSFQFHAGFALFLNYLGSRSYTIYLWHLLLFSLCQFVWLAAWPAIIGSPSFGIGAIIALSALPTLLVIEFSYRVIERPTRLFGRRLAARIGPGTPPPAR